MYSVAIYLPDKKLIIKEGAGKKITVLDDVEVIVKNESIKILRCDITILVLHQNELMVD